MSKSLTFTTSSQAIDRTRGCGRSVARKFGRGLGASAAIAPAHGMKCSRMNGILHGVLRFGSDPLVDRRDLSIAGQQLNGGQPGPQSGRYSVRTVPGLD